MVFFRYNMEEPVVENTNEFIARQYQMEILQTAIKGNTIIYLPTGAGKTYIAIMLINRLSYDIIKFNKKTIFLVNTVPLVEQHFLSLQRHTDFEVGRFSGDQNVDYWTRDQWISQLEKYNVMVFTAQIFLDILQHGYFSLEEVNLLIFDECHQAVDNQPMRQLMQLFANIEPKNQPKVLGLTATLLNGNCSQSKVQQEVETLETTFHSKVATVRELAHVLGYSTNPVESIVTFRNSQPYDVQKMVVADLTKLVERISKFKINQNSPSRSKTGNHFPLLNQTKCDLKVIKKLLNNLILHVDMMGLYGASKAVLSCIISVERMKRNITDIKADQILCYITTILSKVLLMLEREMNGLDVREQIERYSSVQILKLIGILREFHNKSDELFGIIFVKQRFTAKVLYYIIRNLSEVVPEFNYIRSEFMVGFNAGSSDRTTREVHFAAKVNKRIVASFHKGEINLLIASNVVEEGIDIPRCTLVVKFDPPLDYRSYIQSKGRARHGDSKYIIMVPEADYAKYTLSYRNFQEIEKLLQYYLVGKTEDRLAPSQKKIENELYNDQDVEPYCVGGDHSARVTALSAISLVNRYCMSLQRDKYSLLAPEWYLNRVDSGYSVIIEMPIICPLRDPIEGEIMSSKLSAKRAVAMKVCILLHKIGELNDRLLPKNEFENEEDFSYLYTHWLNEENGSEVVEKTNPKPKPGTKKYLRKCKIENPEWLMRQDSSNANTYYLHPIVIKSNISIDNEDDFNLIEQRNIYDSDELGYALLTPNPLPELCDFSIYVSAGELRVHLENNHKSMVLSDSELATLRGFNHFILNDVLKIVHNFLMYDNSDQTAVMLAVPVRKTAIGWDIDIEIGTDPKLVTVQQPSEQAVMELNVTHESHQGKIVCPWYRFNDDVQYLVTRICYDLNALSDFPSRDFNNYASYLRVKYHLTVSNPSQPLLLVKGLSKRLNCLLPRSVTIHGKRNRHMMLEDSNEHLVPETCVVQQFSGILWYKASTLPSIIHKVMCLLRTETLRRAIVSETHIGCMNLPAGKHWQPVTVDPRVLQQEEKKIQPVQHWNIPGSTGTTSTDHQDDINIIKPTLNRDYTAKMIESMYPWTNEQEPIDIERHIENVTKIEIEDFDRFCSTSLVFDDLNIHKQPVLPKYPAITLEHKYQKCPIQMLEPKINPLGPELSVIYQCLMAKQAHDVVNLERHETLGDSFLKLSISIFLLCQYPLFNEGRLTNQKCRIVGNQNLLYCALKRNLGGFMKIHQFAPTTDWLPPSYCVPKLIQTKIEDNIISIDKLFQCILSREEQLTGELSSDTLDIIQSLVLDNSEEESSSSNTTMNRFLNYHQIADKTISDCTEAIIGAYLESNGLIAALSMLNWFGILPPEVQAIELFTRSLPPPAIHESITDAEIISHMPNYAKLEEHLGYKFKNRAYLLQAITHASFVSNRITDCYQRLEFLGDAVLDFLITCHIYEVSDNLTPGQLTDLRSALVNNVTFASLAVRYSFHKHLKTNSCKLMDVIDRFVKFQEERNFVIDQEVLILIEDPPVYMAEMVHVPKTLGDLFESLAGAVFLDTGMDLQQTWLVFHRLMFHEIETFRRNVPKNPVRLLFECPGAAPEFGKIKMQQNGIAMLPCNILVNGKRQEVYGFGENKQQAKRAAAKLALRLING